MKLIFLGTEVGSHRKLLTDMGVTNLGLSYWRAKKRGLPTTKDYLLKDRFPEGVQIHVDPGCHLAVKDGLGITELENYAAEYESWVALNEEWITSATEFDCLKLGINWIEQQRNTFWNDFGLERTRTVWHPEHGIDKLMGLAQRFDHVAIPGDAIDAETTLAARIKSLQQYQTSWHALAYAKPDDLRSIPFSTVSTLAWVAPMLRGETIVYDGSRLVRYPKRMKEQARMRLSGVCARAGLDFEKIRADDPNEVTRLAIWSYLELEKKMDGPDKPKLTIIKDPFLVDNSDTHDDPGSAETLGLPVDNRDMEVRNERRPLHVREPHEKVALPVFDFDMKTVVEQDDSGNDVLRDVPVVRSKATSMRQCNTCFVAANCPAFKADNTCAFDLPVEVKTKDQLRSLLNAIIEMQGARVAFARFGEELNGGYPDPNVGQEIDRLFKLVKTVKELESNNEFVRMTVERQTAGGILSAVFGDRASVLKEIPNGGINADATNRIIDGGINGS
jgi:hypothetical protein